MQTLAITAVVVLISSVVGFITGVLLSRQVLSETKALEQKVINSFNAVGNDMRALEQRVTNPAQPPAKPYIVPPPPSAS